MAPIDTADFGFPAAAPAEPAEDREIFYFAPGLTGTHTPEMRRAFNGELFALFSEENVRQLQRESADLAGEDRALIERAAMKVNSAQYMASRFGRDFQDVFGNFDEYARFFLGSGADTNPAKVYNAIREAINSANRPGPAERMAGDLPLAAGTFQQLSTDLGAGLVGTLSKIVEMAETSERGRLAMSAAAMGRPEAAETPKTQATGIEWLNRAREALLARSREHRRELEILARERGSAESFLEEVASAVIVNAPQMLAGSVISVANPAAGLAYFGMSAASTEYIDTMDDPNMTDAERLLNAAVVGTAEMAFERLGTLPILKKYFSRESAEIAARSLMGAVTRTLREFGADVLREGASEAATGITQRLSRLLIGKDGAELAKMSVSEWYDALIAPAYLEGAVGMVYGGGMAAVGLPARLRMEFAPVRRDAAVGRLLAQGEARLQELLRISDPTDAQVRAIESLQFGIREGKPGAVWYAERLLMEEASAREREDAALTLEELSREGWRQAREQRRIEEKLTAGERVHNIDQSMRAGVELLREFNQVPAKIVRTWAELPEAARGRAEAVGLRPDQVEGVFLPGEDAVYLVAENVPASRMRKVFVHEAAAHYGLRRLFGAKYEVFLEQAGRDFREEISAFAKSRPEYRLDLTTEQGRTEAVEEFLAHLAEEMESGPARASLWQRLATMFREWLRRIPGLRDLAYTRAELDDLLRRSLAAVRTPRGNGARTEGDARFSLPGDRANFASALEDYRTGILPRRVSVSVTSQTPRILLGLNLSDKGLRVFNRRITMPYSVIEKAIGKRASTSTGEGHHLDLETLKKLPESLYNPVMVLDSNTEGALEIYTQLFDRNGNPVMVALSLDCRESIGGRRGGENVVNSIRSVYGKDHAKTPVNRLLDGHGRYVNTKLAATWSRAAGVQFPGAGEILSRSPYTIIDESENVKLFSVAPSVDSAAFKKWFGNSKVVDSDGNPLVVYHGSTADFTVFSYEFANRNGQADGRGFYFTDNRSFAEGYQNKDGKLFEVYLSIQKPLNPDELTITRAELRKILDAIDPSGDYIANYAEDGRGYPGAAWREKALNSTLHAIYDSSESNADILAEIYNSFGGGSVLAEVRRVSGYDGFIKKDPNGNMIYIAFEPAQIKSATNNAGTYDPENPDIRFSIIGEHGARQAITSLEAQNPEVWKMLGISGDMAARHAEAVARLENLDTARAMLAAGKKMKVVKFATGWEKGGDGKWRTETDDAGIRLLNSGVEKLRAGETVRLRQLVEASDLFDAYPDMREIAVMQYSSLSGNAMYHDNVIALSSEALESVDTILHEIQHAIQAREGFSPGGSPGGIPDSMLQSKVDRERMDEIDSELRELNRIAAANAEREKTEFGRGWTDNPESLAVYDRIDALENERSGLMLRRMSRREAYRRLGGEVEARNAAARRTMPLAERLQTLLSETEDVTESDKIYLARETGKALLAIDADLQRKLNTPLSTEEKTEAKKFLLGDPVAETSGKEIPVFPSLGELARYVKRLYREKYDGKIWSKYGFEVILSAKSVDSSIAHGMNREKGQAFALVPEMIQKGIFLGKLGTRKTVDSDVYLFGAPIRIGSSSYIGMVAVLVDANTNRMKLHEVVLQKNSSENGSIVEAGGTSTRFGAVRTILDDIINHHDDSVKNGSENYSNFSIRSLEEEKELMRNVSRGLMPLVENARDNDAELARQVEEKIVAEGFAPDRFDVGELIRMARRALAERKRQIRRAREWESITEIDPFLAALSAVYGMDFRIDPGPKYRGEEFTGYWIAAGGIAPDEAAAVVSRALNREIADDEVMDHFRHLKKGDVLRRAREERARYREALRQEDEAAEDELYDAVMAGEQVLTDDIIQAWPKVAKRVRDAIAPKEEGRARASWEDVRKALGASEDSPSDFFAGLQAGRNEFRRLLKTAANDARDLRNAIREAERFVRINLPPEMRGDYLGRIVKLADYTTEPTPAYPLGRRSHELYRLIQTLQGYRLADRIRVMAEKYRTKRSGRGIPTSVLGEIQPMLEEIRRILPMSDAGVNLLLDENRRKLAELPENPESEGEREKLIESNRLLEMFGKLDRKGPDEIRNIYESFRALLEGGRRRFRDFLTERKATLDDWRERVKAEATGEKMPLTGAVPYEKRPFGDRFLRQNMQLSSLLYRISLKSGRRFEDTFGYELFRRIEAATEDEATRNRKLQEAFDAMLAEIGISTMAEKTAAMKELSELVEHTGVFRTVYVRQVSGNSRKWLSFEERRAQDRKKIKLQTARKMLAAHDSGEKPLDLMTAEFLRRQLAAKDAGLKLETKLFGDEFDDAAMARFMEEAEREDSVVLILPVSENAGTPTEVAMTRDAAMSVWLSWQQPDLRAGMEWNGWTAESIAQLEKFITPRYLELAKKMRAHIASGRAELSRAVTKRYGAALPDNEFYFPASFKNSLGKAVRNDALLGGSYGTMGLNPSFLIARKFHLNDVDVNASAMGLFLSNQLETAHFLAFHEVLRDAFGVFRNRPVMEAITREYGKNTYTQLIDRFEMLAANGRDTAEAIHLVSSLYRFWVPSKIALNLSSVAKQLSGAVSFMNDIPAGAFFAGVAESTANSDLFRRFAESVETGDFLKNRFHGGMDPNLRFLLNNSFNIREYSPLATALTEYGTLPTRWADRVSSVRAGFAVFKYHYEAEKARNGGDERAAWDYGMMRWRRAVDQTQQSGKLMDQNYFQSHAGMYRYLTTFLTNPMQILNLEMQSLEGYFGGKGERRAEAGEKLLRQLVVNHLILPTLMEAITQFFRAGFDWDEYKFRDFLMSWLLGPAEGVVIVGKLVKTLGGQLLGVLAGEPDSGWSRSIFQALPVLDDASAGIDQLARLWNRMENDEDFFDTDQLLRSMKSAADLLMAGGSVHPAAGTVGAAAGMFSALLREIRRMLRLGNSAFDEEER